MNGFIDTFIDSHLSFSFELIILVRLILAVIFGGLIGYEREHTGRPAGLRTHILVSLGAAVIMCVSMYGFEGNDPARLAAQVISGIGFLGAGAIIQGSKGIKGLTTAATLWMSAMIGLAVGNGFYFGSLLATLISLVVLIWFRKLEFKINRSRSRVFALIEWQDNLMEGILQYIQECKLEIIDIESRQTSIKDKEYLRLLITFEKDSPMKEMNELVNKIQMEYNPRQLKLSNN